MWTFQIKGSKREVCIPEKWEEITLGKYAEFIDATLALQKVLKDQKIDDTNIFDIVINYRKEFNNLFSAFTGLESNLVDKIKAENIVTVYLFIRKFLEQPKPKDIDHFVFEGKKYYLPKSKTDYFGNVLEMGEATFGEVVEAMQIQEMSEQFKNNNFKALPYQIAILCKLKDEELNENLISHRAKLFHKLPMNVVWNIAFFLIQRKNESLAHLSQFLKLQIPKRMGLID